MWRQITARISLPGERLPTDMFTCDVIQPVFAHKSKYATPIHTTCLTIQLLHMFFSPPAPDLFLVALAQDESLLQRAVEKKRWDHLVRMHDRYWWYRREIRGSHAVDCAWHISMARTAHPRSSCHPHARYCATEPVSKCWRSYKLKSWWCIDWCPLRSAMFSGFWTPRCNSFQHWKLVDKPCSAVPFGVSDMAICTLWIFNCQFLVESTKPNSLVG